MVPGHGACAAPTSPAVARPRPLPQPQRRAQVTAVANARAIEHVLKRSFSNYPKGQGFHERFAELLGDGIFNIDGAKWRIQRCAGGERWPAHRG